MSAAQPLLEQAWHLREKLGYPQVSEAYRVFHGPGEAQAKSPWSTVAVDRFADCYWLTEWRPLPKRELQALADFLALKGARCAVRVDRPHGAEGALPVPFLGEDPGPLEIREHLLRFEVRFSKTRHPGLFLDHAPLRRRLASVRGPAHAARVLNCFSYTGSLSAACGIGGATQVTSLDLSRPALEWAKRNWALNELPPDGARFLADDFFTRVPRLAKAGEKFDVIILDPPSFSRGSETFSTSRDLARLHDLAFQVLAVGGTLITSINSANVDVKTFEREVARATKRRILQIGSIDLPETFPSRLGDPQSRYLKGFILYAQD
ncbi:MAG: class I SAM-dependent methyltransferase [Bdellovibrionota bacterium]